MNVEHTLHEAQRQACYDDASQFLMAFYNQAYVIPSERHFELHNLSPNRSLAGSKFPATTQPDDHAESATQLEASTDNDELFLGRFAQLKPHIERSFRNQWRDELDAFELDNLIQAGFVHLWLAYQRNPEKFNDRGDGFWFATAKRGAKNELHREFRQRYCQKGSGSKSNRQNVEVMVSAGDLLAKKNPLAEDEMDETILSQDFILSNDTEQYLAIDRQLDIQQLIEHIFRGTDPRDHVLIAQVLHCMAAGQTMSDMAKEAGMKRSTIRSTVQRIRKACGAVPIAKQNKRQGYGDAKDARIRQLLQKNASVPEIARLIGSNNSFVYRRLRAFETLRTNTCASIATAINHK